ncbi:Plipastatin synthase subunit B [Bienertia sinuspersici]
MAESSGEMYVDQEEQKQQVEEENENVSSMRADSLFLFELNLAMVIASLSLSNQELSEFEEDMEKLNIKEQQQDFKALVSKFHARKRGFDELKISDRRATQSRLKTKVLDTRHGRKM